ncbi:MAG TPA: LytR C-terminal domain-containing protein [Gemmatimonadales bacterium]
MCALVACRGDAGRARALPVPGDAGDAVVVEVFNASGRDGLARAGTRVLREAGIDVVDVGNAAPRAAPLDSTEILVRRGPASVGERVRRALGRGRITLAPDSTRLVDASVFLGADFAPRLEFHP